MMPALEQPAVPGENDNRYSVLAFRNRRASGIIHGTLRYHPELLNLEKDARNTAFERDLDKIEQSPEWRRLQGIYQFTMPVHLERQYQHQNRLTHTNDVQTVGRVIARRLYLDRDSIDLVRAIAAIHDMGHMPFSHWGEKAAVEKLAVFGRNWKHDSAGLRVIAEWSHDGLTYPGLNLTLDTIEGLTKRYWHYRNNERLSHFNHAASELPHSIRKIDKKLNLYLDKHNHIEGQIAAIADWIAFTATDVEDGLRSGWMTLNEVFANFPLTDEIYRAAKAELQAYYRTPEGRAVNLQRDNQARQEALNKIFAKQIRGKLIDDLVAQTNANTAALFDGKHLLPNGEICKYADDVREAESLVVGFSPNILQQLLHFQKFCVGTVHQRMLETIGPVDKLVAVVIDDFVAGRLQLSPLWQERCATLRGSASRDAGEIAADLTHLACDFIVQELTDAEVITYVKKNHPDLWQAEFAGHSHPQKAVNSGRKNVNALVGGWVAIAEKGAGGSSRAAS